MHVYRLHRPYCQTNCFSFDVFFFDGWRASVHFRLQSTARTTTEITVVKNLNPIRHLEGGEGGGEEEGGGGGEE